eukprot:SAG31_NODE_12409_length_944_cov_1.020118_1_plen_190_part_01
MSSWSETRRLLSSAEAQQGRGSIQELQLGQVGGATDLARLRSMAAVSGLAPVTDPESGGSSGAQQKASVAASHGSSSIVSRARDENFVAFVLAELAAGRIFNAWAGACAAFPTLLLVIFAAFKALHNTNVGDISGWVTDGFVEYHPAAWECQKQTELFFTSRVYCEVFDDEFCSGGCDVWVLSNATLAKG